MAGLAASAAEFAALARRLKDAGEVTLRRELMKAVTEAARPIAREIADVEHLKPYMPDRYAVTLAADLTVGVQRLTANQPRVSIQAKAAREKKRKVRYLNDGFINHPVFARGERSTWRWSNGQIRGMRAGFFSDPCENAAPEVQQRVLDAMYETARKVTG